MGNGSLDFNFLVEIKSGFQNEPPPQEKRGRPNAGGVSRYSNQAPSASRVRVPEAFARSRETKCSAPGRSASRTAGVGLRCLELVPFGFVIFKGSRKPKGDGAPCFCGFKGSRNPKKRTEANLFGGVQLLNDLIAVWGFSILAQESSNTWPLDRSTDSERGSSRGFGRVFVCG